MHTIKGLASHCNEQYMCYIEHVYHRPCCHWGRDRFIGEPCCRSRFANGFPIACTYAENIGSADNNELCSDCKYRLASPEPWRPLGSVDALLRLRLEEKVSKRESSVTVLVPVASTMQSPS
jgi:hypothetical protein